MSTYLPNVTERDRQWFVIDAQDQVLGRVATRAARVLAGKHKPIYTPFLDTGDHVIVINAAKVHVSGTKETGKFYYHHSGYPGGIKSASVARVRAKHPERLIEDAVKGMLPKTRLGRAMAGKLKVYGGAQHPHQAQQPKALKV